MLGVQTIYLKRKVDSTGTSGTGIVAVGAIFPSGQVFIEWLSFTSSVSIFRNLEHLKEIHGHDGNTEIIVGPIPTDTKYTKVEEASVPKKPRKKKSES